MIISLFTTCILHSNTAEVKLNMNAVLYEKMHNITPAFHSGSSSKKWKLGGAMDLS
jgi:hypothetical protein